MGIPQKNMEIITADEYLSSERQTEERNEFYQGECMAMAGGSRWHNLLAGQIFADLVHHLDGKPFNFPLPWRNYTRPFDSRNNRSLLKSMVMHHLLRFPNP
jgi:hypothetical protein